MAVVSSNLKSEIVDVLEGFNKNMVSIQDMHTAIYECIATHIKNNVKINSIYNGTLIAPPKTPIRPKPLEVPLSIVTIPPTMFSGLKSGGWLTDWFKYIIDQIKLSAMAMPVVDTTTLTPPLNVFQSISYSISIPSHQDVLDNIGLDPFYIWNSITEAIANNINNATPVATMQAIDASSASQGQISLTGII